MGLSRGHLSGTCTHAHSHLALISWLQSKSDVPHFKSKGEVERERMIPSKVISAFWEFEVSPQTVAEAEEEYIILTIELPNGRRLVVAVLTVP